MSASGAYPVNPDEPWFEFDTGLSRVPLDVELAKKLELWRVRSFSHVKGKLDIMGERVSAGLFYVFVALALLSPAFMKMLVFGISRFEDVAEHVNADFMSAVRAVGAGVFKYDRTFHLIWEYVVGFDVISPQTGIPPARMRDILLRCALNSNPRETVRYFTDNRAELVRRDTEFALSLMSMIRAKAAKSEKMMEVFRYLEPLCANDMKITMFMN